MITVTHTAVDTVAAIERVGATPFLVNVDQEFLTLDPFLLGQAITDRTRAVVLVHLYGQAAAIHEIQDFFSVANQRRTAAH